jgi:hypothetical protein
MLLFASDVWMYKPRGSLLPVRSVCRYCAAAVGTVSCQSLRERDPHGFRYSLGSHESNVGRSEGRGKLLFRVQHDWNCRCRIEQSWVRSFPQSASLHIRKTSTHRLSTTFRVLSMPKDSSSLEAPVSPKIFHAMLVHCLSGTRWLCSKSVSILTRRMI